MAKKEKKTLGEWLEDPKNKLKVQASMKSVTQSMESMRSALQIPKETIELIKELNTRAPVLYHNADLKDFLLTFEDFVNDFYKFLTQYQKSKNPQYEEKYFALTLITFFETTIQNATYITLEDDIFYSNCVRFIEFLKTRTKETPDSKKKDIIESHSLENVILENSDKTGFNKIISRLIESKLIIRNGDKFQWVSKTNIGKYMNAFIYTLIQQGWIIADEKGITLHSSTDWKKIIYNTFNITVNATPFKNFRTKPNTIYLTPFNKIQKRDSAS